MTLHKDYGLFVCECDFCGDILETNESEFREAVKALPKNGWSAKNFAGQWHHACDNATCVRDLEHL